MNLIEAYKVLGVHQKMSEEDITSAYRRLSMACHPDRPAGKIEDFKRIQQAYALLKGVSPRTRIEHMKILGIECPVCRGDGCECQQRGWQRITVGGCKNCGGSGYLIPGGE